MPTPKKGPRLASSPAHERLMLANMATSLFANGHIKTTLPKAKRLRPLVERLITFAKRGDLHSRRRVMRVIRNKSIVHKLFTEIAEEMEQREGGYTRIIRIAPRKGDAAPQAIIELVTEPVSPKQAIVKEAEAAAKTAADADAQVVDAAADAARAEGAAADATEQAVEANEAGTDTTAADEAAVELNKVAEEADAAEQAAEESADVADEAAAAEK
ncbi:MAG: 50S ribosomal protein L17 [Bifidobacterium tibiigranuli]|uniref:50S ribosomal protein L17 n=1 Tax=Bifidobacterium tibiigranuli TaxID=2172043 RepID=UPI0023578BFA|nr:50S ribosomal protein L17 [Bifidobacterium tibiigranuli]MCH3975303.1 50S ribosomal protein L17 [Bifidobacterium tibiigranuli]MCH4203502.1 50S ribosomal protein L17 [Bifidobacterium tibiigranuli]MCH4273886.1 50S ribosomal protein L17 [Bifidobacterium tibiigranuli]MCI1791126.1 50S ribosomal protein L17 [Bifidobacterium tibiigranuli]MCI1798451.1 50S ribosomal protein L17 [Bifidobacterium tibiigranuli]